MKKFFSIVLSLSLLCGTNNSVLYADGTSSEESASTSNSGSDSGSGFLFWLNDGLLPGIINGTGKLYNGSSKIINWAANKLESVGNMGYKINGISYGLSALAGLGLAGKSLYDKLKLKVSKINRNVDKVKDEMDKELMCIRGQDNAKLKMKEFVAAVLDARSEAQENGKPYGKGDLIYMTGPSGVGKTFSAECLAKAIMGKNAEPIRIDSSCFDKSSQVSLKSQILYMRDQKKSDDRMSFYYVDNSLAAKIASNPNVVLIFDEYDKWCTPDTDEFLRTIIDKGIIYRDGERIDCSGLLVIVLSNEDHSSVTAGNGQGTFQDDGTGSRTHIVHDKSFLNRLYIVEFDNLSQDDYEKIVEDQLQAIAKRYKKSYSVDFDFGNIAKKIAKKVAKMNQGAREIAKILNSLRMAIIVKRQETSAQFKGNLFKVDYSPRGNVFTLREKTGDNENNSEDLNDASDFLEENSEELFDETEEEFNTKNLNNNFPLKDTAEEKQETFYETGEVNLDNAENKFNSRYTEESQEALNETKEINLKNLDDNFQHLSVPENMVKITLDNNFQFPDLSKFIVNMKLDNEFESQNLPENFIDVNKAVG